MKKQFPEGFFSRLRRKTISKADALDIIISAVGVADMGKQRWFEQEDGSWYDRMECDYVSLNKVVDRVCEAIRELDEC